MARHFPKSAQSSGMDLFSLLTKRRSIRAFKTDPVTPEKIEAILSAGQHSPSGAHRHPWLYKVVTDSDLKSRIREKSEIGDKKWHEEIDERVQKWLKTKHITTEKQFLTDAPVLIAVFSDSRTPYWFESVWISIGYMMLATVDQGLGTVIYTPGDEAFMNEILDVEKHYVPQVILPIGYPLIEPQSSPTKQTDLEYKALNLEKIVVSGNGKDKGSSESGADDVQNNSDNAPVENTLENNDEHTLENNKCMCGCGKKMISLSAKRKFIQGHAQFGENGLHIILKSAPYCKCGCESSTEWDWERMTWKKYINAHIGIRNRSNQKQTQKAVQFDIFES
jgi:iodotyrosine deiodinase